MIGIIRRPNWKKPPSPDDYFDPTTHIATEENFIKFLQAGIYTSDVIGYKVQLSNSVDYNNGLWVIADVNHDSTNTGQMNCYDLISEQCFHQIKFNDSEDNKWRNSIPRTWLNNTFYEGFSTSFKNRTLNIKYSSNTTWSASTWYSDDKIVIPSYKEVNGDTSGTVFYTEGTPYPIFTDNDSRKKLYPNSSSFYGTWWLRSFSMYNYSEIGCVYPDGSFTRNSYYQSYYVAPILRVQ